MPGIFQTLFGGGDSGGGLAHNGNGQVTQLPAADPQQNLNSPNGGNPATAPRKEEPVDPINSQLDSLKAIWNNPTTADGKPVAAQADPLTQQLFNFDQAAVRAGAEKIDFTAGINPELLSKAASGDPESLRDALNQAVRTAFIGNTLNTGSLLNDGFSRHSRNIDAALPSRLKNYQVNSSKVSDPILAHPAVSPLVIATRSMIAQKMPNASAEQIQEATEEYFLRIGNAFVATQKGAEKKKEDAVSGGDIDWLVSMGLDK